EVPERLKFRLPPVQREPFLLTLPAQGPEPRPQTIKVRLPHSADSDVPLDKIVDRLGLAGALAKVNAVSERHLLEEAIRMRKQFSTGDAKNLAYSKDEKAGKEALRHLEESVRILRELQAFTVQAEKKP